MKDKIDKISFKNKYNKKDLQILYLLNQNCRLTARELGKLVHISPQMADYHVKKLIKTKAIKSFHATVSLARLGFQSYTLLLQFERSSLAEEHEMVSFLSKHPLVRHVVTCRGNWDISISFVAKSRIELSLFIDELRRFSGIIGNDTLLIPIKPIKFDDLSFLSKVDYDYHESSIELEASVDRTDKKMLLLLSHDAKMSIRKLSRAIKLSPDSTYKRFKKLLAMGLLRRFKANLNNDVFGLQEYELYMRIDDYSQKEELKLRSFLKGQNQVIRATRIIGTYDLFLVILCKNLDEFESSVNNIRVFFGKRIKSHIFSLLISEVKRTSCPEGIFSYSED